MPDAATSVVLAFVAVLWVLAIAREIVRRFCYGAENRMQSTRGVSRRRCFGDELRQPHTPAGAAAGEIRRGI
jgi:hypothetical protein